MEAEKEQVEMAGDQGMAQDEQKRNDTNIEKEDVGNESNVEEGKNKGVAEEWG